MPVTVLNPDQEGEVDPVEAIDEHDDEVANEEDMGVHITDPEHPEVVPAEEGLEKIIAAIEVPIAEDSHDPSAPAKKSNVQVSDELIKRELTVEDWQDAGRI